jgi:hypothetical protein
MIFSLKRIRTRVFSETHFVSYFAKLAAKRVLLFREPNRPFRKISLFMKGSVSHVSLFLQNEIAHWALFVTCFAKFLIFELPLLQKHILDDKDSHLGFSVAAPHSVDADPPLGKNAAPASTLLYTMPSLLKQTKVDITVRTIFSFLFLLIFDIRFRAGTVAAVATSHYGSGSTKIMRLRLRNIVFRLITMKLLFFNLTSNFYREN